MATLVRMMSASDILIQSADAKRERKMDHSEMAHSRRRAECTEESAAFQCQESRTDEALTNMKRPVPLRDDSSVDVKSLTLAFPKTTE